MVNVVCIFFNKSPIAYLNNELTTNLLCGSLRKKLCDTLRLNLFIAISAKFMIVYLKYLNLFLTAESRKELRGEPQS